MNETQKVQYLIVDTSAFIRNAPLQDIGVNIITEQDVVNEVTSKRQLRRLVVLPYDLKIQNAYPENIKFVTEFAKKTGDYSSLSATDVKVIALTYQLEKEKIGIDHLRTEPKVTQTVDSNVKKAEDLRTPLAGFYMPEDIDEENIKECDDKESKQEKYSENNHKKKIATNLRNRVTNMDFEETEEESESDYRESYSVSGSDYETAESEIDQNRTEDLSTKFSRLTCESTNFIVQDKDDIEHNVDDILIPIKENNDNTDKYNKYKNNKNDDNNDNYEDENDDGDDDDDDDDGGGGDDDGSGWITSENISRIKKELDSDFLEQKSVTVACLTMDFAMQNVLKQIGLNVVALDGRIIKQMRTYIFRCHACYKTTSIMTKVFCPNCGNKTLKKVAVTINQGGKQEIHINFRRPLSKKGKRFSLPLPKGGKHANNPILCEDQPLPDQRPSRLARTKNNPLEDDHIAEYSPFVMRDIHSKSAMLGIRTKGPAKYWMQRNPNEVRKKK
ncbi:RNA-binding protein NOB1 [Melipona quadrifasciata]|uniref:RNA-binding protein NOB1 n=1 Tax=Melipona quadrifasciata TaxID=166423 RepID=A0A0N0U6J5_9HYME|nr:RNA-binding protein NOB1 [Melipona quadrifasciata]